MRTNAFDSEFPYLVSIGQTTLDFSTGSNTAEGDLSGGGDVVGTPGDYTVVGLRDTVSLASNIGGGVLGDVLTITQVSPAIAMFATPSNTGIGSNALLRTTGGAGGVTTIAASGAAQTLMIGGANTFDITLTADCTLALTGAAASGSESSILLILRQDGTGSRLVTWPGSVVWASGSAPTLSTTASTVDFIVLETVDGGTTWFGFPTGGSSGTTSPLTTKGDLWTYAATDARLAVGSNGTGLLADSAATTGNRWTIQHMVGELLMQDGVSNPPVPLETDPSQDDWLYADL